MQRSTMPAAPLAHRGYAWFAWLLLVVNIGVIIWGAFVRATGSGAGCGADWPLCHGAVLPDASHQATFIEFAHRVTSGVALLMVVGLVFWSRRIYAAGSPMRLAAWAALVFILIEALLGAVLVVFELVTDNSSGARAAWMALHLVNTFLLVVPLTLSAWWSSGHPPTQPRFGKLPALMSIALLGMLLLGVSGAIAALGDTLFPVDSLAQGIEQEMTSNAHPLIRLRVFHPLIAVCMALYIVIVAWSAHRTIATPTTHRLAIAITLLFGAELAVGILNVVLLVPVPIQLLHLFLAVLLWISLVLLITETLQGNAEQRAHLAHQQPLPV